MKNALLLSIGIIKELYTKEELEKGITTKDCFIRFLKHYYSNSSLEKELIDSKLNNIEKFFVLEGKEYKGVVKHISAPYSNQKFAETFIISVRNNVYIENIKNKEKFITLKLENIKEINSIQ